VRAAAVFGAVAQVSANDWQTWSRYNALNISKKILPLIHGLADAGMIDLAKGSYSGREAWWNRTTRIRAAEPLVALFRASKATRDDIRQIEGQECIVLKAGDGDKAKLTEYKDTPETVTMRRELEAYNALLAETFIDIPTLEEPWTTRLDERGKEVRVLIDPHHQFVRRIFSRGDWGCNGRFYGPWWQQIGKELRSQIFINDTPTVEVDFKGLHVAILSAQKGLSVEGDPYALPEGLVAGTPPQQAACRSTAQQLGHCLGQLVSLAQPTAPPKNSSLLTSHFGVLRRIPTGRSGRLHRPKTHRSSRPKRPRDNLCQVRLVGALGFPEVR
jgi:hypothetical protein